MAARKPAPEPLHRDRWVSEFMETAMKLKPYLPFKFARTIAMAQWGGNAKVDPKEAARAWAAKERK